MIVSTEHQQLDRNRGWRGSCALHTPLHGSCLVLAGVSTTYHMPHADRLLASSPQPPVAPPPAAIDRRAHPRGGWICDLRPRRCPVGCCLQGPLPVAHGGSKKMRRGVSETAVPDRSTCDGARYLSEPPLPPSAEPVACMRQGLVRHPPKIPPPSNLTVDSIVTSPRVAKYPQERHNGRRDPRMAASLGGKGSHAYRCTR
jgi:hypothetical protein